jgi:hypothetical protein
MPCNANSYEITDVAGPEHTNTNEAIDTCNPANTDLFAMAAELLRITSVFSSVVHKLDKGKSPQQLRVTLRSYIDTLEELYKQIS